MSTTTTDAVTSAIRDGATAGMTNGQTQPAPADATGTNGGQQGSDERTYSKSEMEMIVKDRLDRDRKVRETADAKAKSDAELKALEDQQKDKERADKLAERLLAAEAKYADMETLQQERDRLANVVDGLVTQQREGLPDYAIELLDGKDVVEQLAWLNKHRATLTGASGPTSGIAAAPRPAGPVNRQQQIEQEIEAQRSRRR